MDNFIHLLKQVKHRLWILSLDLEARIDHYRLYRDFPILIKLSHSTNFKQVLTSSYIHYSTRVSQPKMAISFELATFLFSLCICLKPKTIIDLGSGYSTYVFAYYKYKLNQRVKLLSIDDNSKWLSKTDAYLLSVKLTISWLMKWSSFKKIYVSKIPGELILYDLGTMKTRIKYFSNILSKISKGAFVIVDDMHMLEYSRFVRKQIGIDNIQLYSLRSFTKDRYGRFAVLLVRK